LSEAVNHKTFATLKVASNKYDIIIITKY